MQLSYFAIVLSVFNALCIMTDASLQCYTCAGTCSANTFKEDQHRVSTCPNTTRGCFKYVLNNDGRHSTYRGCARVLDQLFCSAVKPIPSTRVYACFTCDTHLCNTAEYHAISLHLLSAALLGVYLLNYYS